MESKLTVEIGAEITNLNAQFAKATQIVSTGSRKMESILSASDKAYIKHANTVNKSSSVISGSTQSAASSVVSLGRSFVEGGVSVDEYSNHLSSISDILKDVKISTTGGVSGVKALAASMIGGGGITLAVSAAVMAIMYFVKANQEAKKAALEAAEAIKKEKEEFIKTPYTKAVTDLQELTRNVDLAKKGFLDKKEVLKQYNEGIGATIGKVTSLDQAEQALVKNGDAYLRLMFLKANAEFAFRKAAEESYNLSVKQADIDAKAPKVSKDFDINRNREVKETVINLRDLLKTANQITPALDGVNTKVEIISKNLGEQLLDESQLKSLEKVSGKAVDIAKSAQQQVIDFAKKNGFNLNGLFDIDQSKDKPLKNLRENLIEGRTGLQDVMGRVNTDLDDFVLDYNKTAEELGKTPLLPVEAFKIQGKEFESAFKQFNEQLDLLAYETINSSLIGLGSAIGEAMATGTNAFEAGGKALLGSFGGFLTEYGKLLIKYGAAAVLKGKLDLAALIPGAGIPAGIAAIAAGVALVAAGAAIGSFASGNNNSSEGVTRPRKIPGFANGVRDFAGGLAVVGERGPELVNLPTGSGVIPNHNLSSFGGGDIVFNVSSRIDQLGNLITAIDRERSRLRRVGA